MAWSTKRDRTTGRTARSPTFFEIDDVITTGKRNQNGTRVGSCDHSVACNRDSNHPDNKLEDDGGNVGPAILVITYWL